MESHDIFGRVQTAQSKEWTIAYLIPNGMTVQNI